ncbi:MAG: sporulation peptidase YabG [Bacillota bacterium]
MDIKIGDIVGRRSYDCDIAFKVHDILRQGDGSIIILKGVSLRILADAPEDDVVKLPQSRINDVELFYKKRIGKLDERIRKLCRRADERAGKAFAARVDNNMFKRPGKILHLDGDNSYLDMCMKSYKEYGIEAYGRNISEAEQPKRVTELLIQYNPDILVLTGHDSKLKSSTSSKSADSIGNYRNSRYYIEAVKEARKHEPSLDDLVIFAGACQSFFEGIMQAGANFASSPDRILIHALDPVMICKIIAYTPIDKIAPLQQLLGNTISGIKGVGGIQTRGKYRDGMPKTLNDKL